jgi:hypothetical protein
MKDVPTEQAIRAAVVAVVERAVAVADMRVLGALIPFAYKPLRMIHYIPEDEVAELVVLVRELDERVRWCHDFRSATRLRVHAYCQIMEAEFPAAVVWNLLRLASQLEPSWEFHSITADGKEVPADEPTKRFAEMLRLSESAGLEVGAVLNRLWRNRLRNAFSHSQFVTLDGGDFLGTRNVSPLTANALRPADRRDSSGENPFYYRAAEIGALYDGALEYLDAVLDCYRELSEHFKDGAFHQLPTGPVRWDAERHRWMTS